MTRTIVGGTPSARPESLAQKPVLVVDDFHNMRSTLRQMLLTAGYETIDVAVDGEDAIDKLTQRRYEIVLCDYNLGEGLDGQQVLDLARARGLLEVSTLFIMVTAETTSDMVMGAVESMPDGYLSKPFSKDLLAVRLDRGLRRKQSLKRLDPFLRRGDLAGAIQEAGRMLDAGEGRESDLIRLRAYWAWQTGDLDLARTSARTAWENVRVAWAGSLLADLDALAGEVAVAEAGYREVMRETPQFMPAHDHLATLLKGQGRAAEALEILRAAAERSPKSLGRQRALGELAQANGEAELALQAWRRALRIARQLGQPHPSDAVGRIGALIASGDTRKARQAVRDLDRDFANHPEQPWYSVLARLRLAAGGARGEMDGALRALEALPAEGMPEPVREPLNHVLAELGQT
ncbi:response regulator [Thioalkalivibrio sp. ALJT]|uniref:response regulator n=1 Tax=Thioalkalivibrio sp. ALJT TaxID=1158146 RepID=UPI000368B975|nr:response regulator [Thioalkalivibrio sp. ALJT]